MDYSERLPGLWPVRATER